GGEQATAHIAGGAGEQDHDLPVSFHSRIRGGSHTRSLRTGTHHWLHPRYPRPTAKTNEAAPPIFATIASARSDRRGFTAQTAKAAPTRPIPAISAPKSGGVFSRIFPGQK